MTDSIAERVAENAPAMLVYLDADLRVRFANRHCYELLGRAPREILGRLLAELVDPRTLKYALAHVADVESGNHAPRDYVLRDKDGAQRFVQLQAMPDRDAEGRSIGYFACGADNSAARGVRAALARTEEQLSITLAACEAGIWDWDLASCNVHYSPEFASLLRYRESVPADFAFFAELHPEDSDAVHEAIAEAIHVGGGFDAEFRMRCAGGDYRWLRGVGRAMRDADTGAVVRFTGTATDISARKEAERQLREANQLVEASLEGCLDMAQAPCERKRLDSIRRELLASANHELRTPLASIIAALELLRDAECPPHERNAEAFLKLALQNAERLARVIEEWLDLERVDLGACRTNPTNVDVNALVASLTEEHVAAAGERTVLIQTGLAGAATRVRADPERLRQALSHLVSSAIERSPRDAVVRLQVGVRRNNVTVLVEDQGDISLPRTDLGLSVSRAIIERLGGTLCIAKRTDVGGAFHVELPRLVER